MDLTLTNDGRRLQPVDAGAVMLPDGQRVQMTGTVTQKWVDDFGALPLDTSLWDVIAGGRDGGVLVPTGAQGTGVSTGVSYTIAGSALVVSMGTAADAEIWFLSKAMFTNPVDIYATLQASQRIANNNFYVDFVECDANGALVANANAAGEVRNRASFVLNGTNATTYTIEAQSDDTATANATAIAAQQGSAAPGFDLVMEVRPQDVFFSTGPTDSPSGRIAAPGRMSKQVPDPNKLYKLRIRGKNASSAPASNTDFSVFRIMVADVQELTAEVTSGRGDLSPGKAIAVNLVGGVTTLNAAAGTYPAVQGPVFDNANGSPNSGALQVGGLILSTVGGPAAGSTGRYGSLFLDLARRLITKPLGNTASHDFNRVTVATTTETTVIAAAAAIKHDVQSLTVANRDTASATVDFRDATAGTVRLSMVVAAGDTKQLTFPAGLPQAAVNTNWTAQLRAATTANAVEISTSSYRTTA